MGLRNRIGDQGFVSDGTPGGPSTLTIDGLSGNSQRALVVGPDGTVTSADTFTVDAASSSYVYQQLGGSRVTNGIATVTTTTSASVSIASFRFASSSAGKSQNVQATFMAHATTGSFQTSYAMGFNTFGSGSAIAVGSPSQLDSRSTSELAGCSAAITSSLTTALFNVQGVQGTTLAWTCVFQVIET